MFTISETALHNLSALNLQTLLTRAEKIELRIENKSRTTRLEREAASKWGALKVRCQLEQKRRQKANQAYHLNRMADDTSHAKAMSVSVFGGVE